MRILFLTNAYPDFDSSHRAIFIRKMANLLQRDGYEITVVTPKIYRGSHYFEEQNGIKVYRFPFFAGDRLLIEYDKIPYVRMILYYIMGAFFSTFVMLKYRCQLIHVHWAIPTGPIGVLVSTLFKKPFVVTIHGSDFRLAMDKSFLLKRIFLYVCKKAGHINCVSEVMKKGVEQLGIREEKISTFPMGIDESFLEARRKRQKKSTDPAHTIFSNRNLLSFYNVSLLIKAIPEILKEEPGTQFLIAGDGPEKKNLGREVKDLDLGSKVQFLGRVPHAEMPSLLAQADIYVSTSLYDGTSVSLLEALGSGAFPVVTDIPSNREWIFDGENGFLVPTDEERIFAMRIIEAIRNRSLLEKARQKNLGLVTERALWPATIEKTKRIYEKVLSSEN